MKTVTKEEWEMILEQSPTNYDLRYLIEYTTKKEEAEKLLNERTNPKRMIDIIKAR